MQLDPSRPDSGPEIASESDFFQRVKKRTYGTIGWERIEPANESGFPDTYFVVKKRSGDGAEGTVEFKYKPDQGAPNLSGDMVRGNQKAALIEYQQMGGHRRFVLVYTGRGEVWLYNTADATHSVVSGENRATAIAQMEEPSFTAWLVQCLNKDA